MIDPIATLRRVAGACLRSGALPYNRRDEARAEEDIGNDSLATADAW